MELEMVRMGKKGAGRGEEIALEKAKGWKLRLKSKCINEYLYSVMNLSLE